jgi:hypothetical protein
MLHTRLDTIMFGCVLALLWNNKQFQRVIEKLLRPELFACSLLFLTVIGPLFETGFRPRYQWIVGYPLHGVLISFILVYVVKKPASLPGRFLNLGVMKHIGIISYSLYLWQEMFDGPHVAFFPWNLIAFFARSSRGKVEVSLGADGRGEPRGLAAEYDLGRRGSSTG